MNRKRVVVTGAYRQIFIVFFSVKGDREMDIIQKKMED